MHDGSTFADSYLLERNVELSGEVRTYASLFRLMKPGNIAIDLSEYDQLVFEGSGVGDVVLTIAKSSIDSWNEQYRISFTLSAEEKTYRIDFDQLKSSILGDGFTAEDIESVTITFNGDGSNYEAFEISVKNMRFTNGNNMQPSLEESLSIDMNVYPNPMPKQGYVEFELPESGMTRIMVYDVTGKEVFEVRNQELFAGNHRLPIQLDHVDVGIYMVKMIFNYQVETKRINLVR
ncbi:MAG: T9SS type A sorting domain-containing protein, partial [Candidatus Delongbacteria bacterium]|nr:T9SS type A sorting domain-containing protein [Candidatus Delongbacteria bacterium]